LSLPHFDVGKYAAFIWPAYGVTVLGFAWMIAATLLRARRWRREAERLEKARPSRAKAAEAPGAGPGPEDAP
jgi:heme exporter protein D